LYRLHMNFQFKKTRSLYGVHRILCKPPYRIFISHNACGTGLFHVRLSCEKASGRFTKIALFPAI
jgi:hypothetical protein